MKALQPRQLVIVAALVAAVAAASALGTFGDGAPPPAAAANAEPDAPVPRARAVPAPRPRAAALAALDTSLIRERQPAGPLPHDAFARHSWVPPAPPPPPEPPPAAAAPPPPPQAPPLPFKYLGMLEDAPAPTVWYLAVGERLIVAAGGETIDGVWRVDGLQEGRLVFTYMPLTQRLSLAIGGPP